MGGRLPFTIIYGDKTMINQSKILASEPFADWADVHMRLVQKSRFEWVVETVSFSERGVYIHERLHATREYGPLAVTFLRGDEWATDAMTLLQFAMKHLGDH